jgi:hypothetical protein
VSKAFTALQLAATPDRVSQDFVKTLLQIPGSSGDQMTSFLRRLGFASGEGVPTELYRQYRNPETAPRAMAQAIRETYTDLAKRNEFFFKLSDEKLKGLIAEVTGEAAESRPLSLMFSTLKNLISLADFDSAKVEKLDAQQRQESNLRSEPIVEPMKQYGRQPLGDDRIKMNLGYTINLNLPATTDIEVFNAIFKSLKEHLLNE